MSVVTEHLQDQHVEFEALEHGSAHTALQEALQLGIGADRVAKAVVLDTPDGHAVAVIAGWQRLDMHDCKEALGCSVHLATEDELERDFPQFEPGAFPAVPSMMDFPYMVDPEVMHHDEVIIGGGDPRHSVRLATADLFDHPNVMVAPIARHAEDDKPHVRA